MSCTAGVARAGQADAIDAAFDAPLPDPCTSLGELDASLSDLDAPLFDLAPPRPPRRVRVRALIAAPARARTRSHGTTPDPMRDFESEFGFGALSFLRWVLAALPFDELPPSSFPSRRSIADLSSLHLNLGPAAMAPLDRQPSLTAPRLLSLPSADTDNGLLAFAHTSPPAMALPPTPSSSTSILGIFVPLSLRPLLYCNRPPLAFVGACELAGLRAAAYSLRREMRSWIQWIRYACSRRACACSRRCRAR